MAWLFSHQVDNWTDCCIDPAERPTTNTTVLVVLASGVGCWPLVAGIVVSVSLYMNVH